MPSKIPAITLPVTVTTAAVGLAAGLTEYKFGGFYDAKINLADSSGIDVVGGAGDNEFVLGASSGDFLNAGSGNDEFIVSVGSTDLAGNVLIGGAGFNEVVLKDNGQTADLTAATYGVQSTGVDSVVGGHLLGGETVDLTLGQVLSTDINGGIGKDANRAFVALIGTDGVVNLAVPTAAKFVGVMDASGAGFDGAGNALSAGATAALDSEVTSIGSVAGTLARTYTGSASASVQTKALKNLDAYVFQTGTVANPIYETVWTDGTITTTNTLGATATYTPPTPAASLLPGGLGTIQILDTSRSYVGATLSVDANTGESELQIGGGTAPASAAITVTGSTSGTIVRGDSGANGGDYFNLAGSGGANTIVGSAGNDVFDLGASGALSDMVQGGAGFNVVTDQGGADVDLTAATTGVAAKAIQAVVGSTTGDTTVELDLSTLATVKGAAVFEAFLGSASSTVTLSNSTGNWIEAGTFAPGVAAPAGATALTDASLLDTLFGATKSQTAENSLSGYVFEQVTGTGIHQHVVKTVTVYTDATVVNSTAPALLAQSMSQMGSTSAATVTGAFAGLPRSASLFHAATHG